MIKKTILLFSFIFLSMATYAQTDTAVADTAWKIGGDFSLQFNQASYTNWQAGGVNSVAGNTLLDIFANYDKGGRWTWVNSLKLAYGLNYQDTVFNKTDDRIELESRVDRNIGDHWNASALVNFRTQFSNGYANPGERGDSIRISSFMAPGYLLTALGFTYKPNNKFSAFISPITSKMTFVNDQRLADMGAFGVDSGKTFRQEIGGYVNIAYNTPLVTDVKMQFTLDLFSNYLDGQYKFIDVNSGLMILMKVNKYITATLSCNLIYDNDILIDVNGDGIGDGPRTQFKEVLGVGLAYSFGDKRAK